jgi:hypothetical protein
MQAAMAPRPATASQRLAETTEAISRFRNEMPTPCTNCSKASPPRRCLVDVRSGRCKSCNDSHLRCDLRVTFKEFEKLAATRARLSKAADEAEDELEDAEKEAARLIAEAHEMVAKARMKARRKRKELRFAESKEDGSYQRELAAIEAVRAMEQEASAASTSAPSVDDLLASSELLDFPDLGDFDAATLAASPFAWGQMTGSAFPLDTGLSGPSS